MVSRVQIRTEKVIGNTGESPIKVGVGSGGQFPGCVEQLGDEEMKITNSRQLSQ